MRERVKNKRCYHYPEAQPCPFVTRLTKSPQCYYRRAEEYGDKKDHPAHPQLLLPYSMTLGTYNFYAPFAYKKGLVVMDSTDKCDKS